MQDRPDRDVATPPSTKKPRGKAVSKREHELDLSEQVVLKAKQFLKSLQQDESALSINEKKVSSVLEQVQSRLKPACLDVYAEDYHKPEELAGASTSTSGEALRDGMALLQDLQDARAKLEKAVPLVAAWSKEKIDVRALTDACVAAAAVGIAIVKPICIKVARKLVSAAQDGRERAC